MEPWVTQVLPIPTKSPRLTSFCHDGPDLSISKHLCGPVRSDGTMNDDVQIPEASTAGGKGKRDWEPFSHLDGGVPINLPPWDRPG